MKIGVSILIKKCFVPDFSYKLLVSPVRTKGGRKKRAAAKHGMQVDRELTLWYNKQQPPLLLESKAIIKLFHDRRLQFISSQTYVCCNQLNISTKIDLVMRDADLNRIVIVEVKSGCKSRRCTTRNQGKIATTMFNNTLLNQHQLQCSLGRYLYGVMHDIGENEMNMLLIYTDVTGCIETFSEEQFVIPMVSDQMKRHILSFQKNKKYKNKQKKSYKSDLSKCRKLTSKTSF